MLKRTYLKMSEAGGQGDNSGGGGAATGGAGGAGQGSGTSGANSGGGLLTKDSGGSGAGTGAGSSGATGDQGGGTATAIKYPDNWKLGLPQELQESGALKLIHDIPSLAKSYHNAQKLIGADKVAIPSKHATPEEWRDVYTKLGLPKEVKDYKIEVAKDSGVGEEFGPQLAAKAHELGIFPQQAQGLANWISDLNKNAMGDLKKNQEAQLAEEVGKLQTEWGAAYQEKLSDAQRALSHFADKETMEHINKTGLSNDIQLVKLFSKIAGVLKEDGILKHGAEGSGSMTPAAAKEAYGVILGNMEHPYYQKDHPNHKAAVAEVTKLMTMATKK